MIQRGEHLRFALEARQTVGIAANDVGQDLERDVALQLRVARAIHLAHPAGPKGEGSRTHQVERRGSSSSSWQWCESRLYGVRFRIESSTNKGLGPVAWAKTQG